MPFDLTTPAGRREVLRAVDVDAPHAHHAVLQDLFDRERAWREDPTAVAVDDEYEHVYAAAFLLFVIGDPSDAVRLYDVKLRTTDFDLALGSDAHTAFGAGRAETLAWLAAHSHRDEHDRLADWLVHAEEPSIEEWARFRRAYFWHPDRRSRFDPLPPNGGPTSAS